MALEDVVHPYFTGSDIDQCIEMSDAYGVVDSIANAVIHGLANSTTVLGAVATYFDPELGLSIMAGSEAVRNGFRALYWRRPARQVELDTLGQ